MEFIVSLMDSRESVPRSMAMPWPAMVTVPDAAELSPRIDFIDWVDPVNLEDCAPLVMEFLMLVLLSVNPRAERTSVDDPLAMSMPSAPVASEVRVSRYSPVPTV